MLYTAADRIISIIFSTRLSLQVLWYFGVMFEDRDEG